MFSAEIIIYQSQNSLSRAPHTSSLALHVLLENILRQKGKCVSLCLWSQEDWMSSTREAFLSI